MNWFTGIVLYILIWWVVIFMVLPMGVKTAEEGSEKTVAGAPIEPNIKKKFILTTIISAGVWIVAFLIISYGPFDFREIAKQMRGDY